jgi:ATP-binding cassette, subfamily B, bacterial PglK
MSLLQRVRTIYQEVQLVAGESLRSAPLILLFSLVLVALDLLGVLLIAPFVGLLMKTDMSFLPQSVIARLGEDPVSTMGLIIVAVFAIKAIATLTLQAKISKMSETIRASVMRRLLSCYQSRSYRVHLEHASTDLINRLVWYSQAFSINFVGSIMRLFADAMVFVALGALIAYANPLAMLLLMSVLLLVFFFVQIIVKDRLSKALAKQATMTSDVMHSATQAIAGLREVRILGCEEYFLKRLSKAADGLIDASSRVGVLYIVPRHVIEFAMVGFIVALVFISRWLDPNSSELLPFLGLMGAASIRLMPASTSLLTQFNMARSNRFVSALLARDLSSLSGAKNPAPAARPEQTTELRAHENFVSLEAQGIAFAYSSEGRKVFQNLSFAIKAGETIGLVGPSGAGKSTLADVLLGFLDMSDGDILINGRSLRELGKPLLRHWQSMVAYIPQQSYLTDDTLRRNVALGIPDDQIDDARVERALEDAQLGQVLRQLPKGLDTQLGERGVRFSGGQRQRISIARALYYDRQFLVFDEATSALDVETEREIVETIRALAGKKTVLLIAHRDTTLAVCNRMIRLQPAAVESALA